MKTSRHRFEWPLFALASVMTLAVFIGAIAIASMHDQAVAAATHFFVDTYRQGHVEAQGLGDADIAKLLPEDDQAVINAIDALYLPLVLLAPLALLVVLIYSIGKLYGGLRADGVKAGPTQFPQVYALWADMAQELGFKTTPDLYVQNGNGTLNAYATCIPGYRRFGAIYSDILERALANNDKDVLRFVLGHELGHIRLGHVYWWYFMLTFLGNMPGITYIIGLPLSRAREYGCDKVGLHLSRDQQCKGLMMLAAGKHLYQQVDLAFYESNQIAQRSIWDAVHNFFIDHPNITWRIAALRQNRHGDLLWARKSTAPKAKDGTTL